MPPDAGPISEPSPPPAADSPASKRRYTVSDAVRRASRANLERANAARDLKYRPTEARAASQLANLARARPRRWAEIRDPGVQCLLAPAVRQRRATQRATVEPMDYQEADALFAAAAEEAARRLQPLEPSPVPAAAQSSICNHPSSIPRRLSLTDQQRQRRRERWAAVPYVQKFRPTVRRVTATFTNWVKAQKTLWADRTGRYTNHFIRGVRAWDLDRSALRAGEDPAAFRRHVALFQSALPAETAQQRRLVQGLAEAVWRALRAFAGQAHWEKLVAACQLAELARERTRGFPSEEGEGESITLWARHVIHALAQCWRPALDEQAALVHRVDLVERAYLASRGEPVEMPRWAESRGLSVLDYTWADAEPPVIGNPWAAVRRGLADLRARGIDPDGVREWGWSGWRSSERPAVADRVFAGLNPRGWRSQLYLDPARRWAEFAEPLPSTETEWRDLLFRALGEPAASGAPSAASGVAGALWNRLDLFCGRAVNQQRTIEQLLAAARQVAAAPEEIIEPADESSEWPPSPMEAIGRALVEALTEPRTPELDLQFRTWRSEPGYDPDLDDLPCLDSEIVERSDQLRRALGRYLAGRFGERLAGLPEFQIDEPEWYEENEQDRQLLDEDGRLAQEQREVRECFGAPRTRGRRRKAGNSGA